jgi:hypothetical protein
MEIKNDAKIPEAENNVTINPDITIAVSYARPRMVLKDHSTNEMKEYEVVSMENIDSEGRRIGMIIKACETKESKE